MKKILDKIKVSGTILHTYIHTYIHGLRQERRYAYYLSLSPFYIPLAKEVIV